MQHYYGYNIFFLTHSCSQPLASVLCPATWQHDLNLYLLILALHLCMLHYIESFVHLVLYPQPYLCSPQHIRAILSNISTSQENQLTNIVICKSLLLQFSRKPTHGDHSKWNLSFRKEQKKSIAIQYFLWTFADHTIKLLRAFGTIASGIVPWKTLWYAERLCSKLIKWTENIWTISTVAQF